MNMILSKLRETVKNQGRMACCHPWGHKESDMTGRLKNDKRLQATDGIPGQLNLQTQSSHLLGEDLQAAVHILRAIGDRVTQNVVLHL